MSESFKKRLVLIVGATTCFILIFSVANTLFGLDETTQVNMPDTAVVLDNPRVQDLPDQEIVVHTVSSKESPEEVQRLEEELSKKPTGRRTERVLTDESPNFTIDDLSHLDLGFNQPATEAPVVLDEISVPPTQINEIIKNPVSNTPQSKPATYASIANLRFKDCGEIDVPSGFRLALFAMTAGNDPAVECLGKAVAQTGCGEYIAEVSAEGNRFNLYVGSRPDDKVCSVGVSLGTESVVLCSVTQLMNIGSDENKTFTQWQAEFKEEPGQLFASMYFDNVAVFENPDALTEYDCKLYTN